MQLASWPTDKALPTFAQVVCALLMLGTLFSNLLHKLRSLWFSALVALVGPSVLKSMKKVHPDVAPFGTLLGVTDGGVEVYSCDYDTVDKAKYPSRESFSGYYNGVYTGFRFQCVELARRYLVVNYAVTFDSIPMAYDIFNLKHVRSIKDEKKRAMKANTNGGFEPPVKGSMLIWEAHGEFKVTGHVAIVVEVTSTHVDIVEQNVEDAIWPQGQKYSRRLKAWYDEEGGFHVQCTYHDGIILGWMNLELGHELGEQDRETCTRDDLDRHIIEITKAAAKSKWLDTSSPAVELFAKEHGERLVTPGEQTACFYSLTESGHAGLKQATEELHRMFLQATDHVVQNDSLLGSEFKIPEKLWAKIRRSWFLRNKDIVSGRFDFALTKNGIKAYEYNADSASCLMEAGYIQDRWARAAGIGTTGQDPSAGLFDQLVETWKARNVQGTMHMLRDAGVEETYHTLYMKEAAERAGIHCKVVEGTSTFSWSQTGQIQDADGEVVKTVWKTWSWQTALNQLNELEFDDYLVETEQIENERKARNLTKAPLLVDILLSNDIRVFEPLWTLIPACKAILPILWQMYPNHPLLLKSSFQLTPDLLQSGYAQKPVTGRGGYNVALYDKKGNLVEQTEGKFHGDKDVYQELCYLPKYDGENVQVCCFAINGEYGGTVLRVDKSNIIGMDSGVYCLRIVNDE